MVGSTCDFSVFSGPGVLCYVPVTSYEHYWTVGAFLPVCGDPQRLISALVLSCERAFRLENQEEIRFLRHFLLKSPRTVIPNLGTHRTELRQVRADFEVFEWSLTVLVVRSRSRA